MACSSFSGRVLLFRRQQATLSDFRTNSKRFLFGPGLSFPSSAASSCLYFIQPFPFAACCCSSARFHLHFLPQIGCGNGNNNNNGHNGNNGNNNNNNNNNGHDGNSNNQDPLGLEGSPFTFRLLLFLFSIRVNDKKRAASTSIGALLFFVCLLGCFWHLQFFRPALATSPPATTESLLQGEVGDLVLWEVRGSRWTRIVSDSSKDTLVTCGDGLPSSIGSDVRSNLWKRSVQFFLQLMLPQGYPHSVSSDYLEYSLWRGVQGVASQINSVLATQALLYAVGLGQGAIPTAAAVNWVLKDGIGYLSKIFLSRYGRHFDVHPKGWRLFADLLENSAYGMELFTPAFSHIFVFIGATAGASRAAAALIQASTRSCFHAGFATQRNFAEVIAKGEAQGMVSKSLGILLGIALANCVGSSTTLALGTFSIITCIHMFCNLKSYLSIQLRTLNPYRASLVFSEYLLTGQIPPIKEVNNEEPLFPSLPVINVKPMSKVQSHVLSSEAKDAAAEIEHRLQLGSKLSDVVNTKEDAFALFDLFRNEGYMLTEKKGSFCVLLKEGCAPEDMLKSLFHVNYLYWLERNLGIESRGVVDDCSPGGRLQISLDYVKREFNHVKHDGQLVGWVTDGLVARPLANRIRLGYEALPAQ